MVCVNSKFIFGVMASPARKEAMDVLAEGAQVYPQAAQPRVALRQTCNLGLNLG